MFFKDDYFFLSNFYPCKVTIYIEGKQYIFSNSESAFQAQKNYSLLKDFELTKGLEAKRLGEKIPLTTENWETERLYAMARALHSKFSNIALFYQLSKIEGEIIEDNYWNDTTWGRCKGQGKNYLGKLLTRLRDNKNDLNDLNQYIKNELLKN